MRGFSSGQKSKNHWPSSWWRGAASTLPKNLNPVSTFGLNFWPFRPEAASGFPPQALLFPLLNPPRNFSVLACSRANSGGNTFLGFFAKHKRSFLHKTSLHGSIEFKQKVKRLMERKNIIQATCFCLSRLTEIRLDEYGVRATRQNMGNSVVDNVNIPLRTWRQATALVNEVQRSTCWRDKQ